MTPAWSESVERLELTRSEIRAEMTRSLRELKETHRNPDASVLPGGRCFVIKSSSLTEGWAPETYLFACQYDRLIEIVEKFDPSIALHKLRMLVEMGKDPIGPEGYRIRFHPAVIEKVRGLL